MNIFWKFEEVIFINNKDMGVKTCAYNTFLNMTSLTSIISSPEQSSRRAIVLPSASASTNVKVLC